MKQHFLLFAVIASVCASLQAQTGAIADSVAKFFAYHQGAVQEKLYITTDKPYYEAGDTLWFRGSLVCADQLSYLVKSNYIIVELLNRSDALVMRRKVLREGLCFQHNLPLGTQLQSGEYTLRAYTSWMRNFPDDFFFSRKITIVNRSDVQGNNLQGPSCHSNQQGPAFSIQFFPEGGARIANQRQRIAYKAEGADGYPIEVQGEVRDSKQQVVCSFKSEHDGMGTFWIPAADNRAERLLTAYVTATSVDLDLDQPATCECVLPRVEQQPAYALQITRQTPTELQYQVLANAAAQHQWKGDSLLLIAHGGSRLQCFLKVAPGQQGSLSLNNFRQGINHLVLATAQGQGLSRRLLFHQRPDFQVETQLDVNSSWKANSLVEIQLQVSDFLTQRPLRGDFSISVLDAGYVNVGFDSLRDNLSTYFLLTSDLPGYVHRPAAYFGSASVHLDLLMLTHGWSRFATTQVFHQPSLDFPNPLEQREWVSGLIKHATSRKGNEIIRVSVVDTLTNTFGSGTLDNEGRFFIDGLNYSDQSVLNLRVLSKWKNPQYVFDAPTFPAFSHKEPFLVNFPKFISQVAQNELFIGRDGMRTVLLQHVEVVDARKSKVPQFQGIMTERYRNADYLAENYDLYQYDNALTLINELIEREWSLYVNPLSDSSDESLDTFRPQLASVQWGPLGSFVIGSEFYTSAFSAVGILERTRSCDIERIEVLDKDHNLIDPGSGKAVLVVVTKPGSKKIDGTEDNRFITHRTFGYTLPEYFYHPIYKQPDFHEPDLRKTLAWEASFQTDVNGRATLAYYESDHIGPRAIIIEGITFNGRPLRILKYLTSQQ